MDFTRSRGIFDDMQAFHQSCPMVGNAIAGGASFLLLSSIVASTGAVFALTFGVASLAALFRRTNASIQDALGQEKALSRFLQGLEDAKRFESVEELTALSYNTQKNILLVAAQLRIISEDDYYTARQSNVLLSVFMRNIESWHIKYLARAKQRNKSECKTK